MAPRPLPHLLLTVDGVAVAPVEIAATARSRGRGLLGRTSLAGALWLPGVRSVHGIGMRFALDVARLGADGRVRRIDRLPPGRVLLPRRGVRHTVEAEAGQLAAWGIRPGSRLGIAQAGDGPGGDDVGEGAGAGSPAGST